MSLRDAVGQDQILLSNSMMSQLTDCERKFLYGYVRGWEADPKRAMSLGSWFHALAAVAHLRKGLEEGTLLYTPETLHLGFEQMEAVTVVADRFLLSHGTIDYPMTPSGCLDLLTDNQWAMLPRSVKDDYNDDSTYFANIGAETFPDQVWDLFTRWEHEWKSTLRDEKVLLVEHQWQREHEGLTYGGRVDVVVQRADGFVVIRDEKTTSSKPSMSYRLTNLQTLLYVWGLTPTLEENGYGGGRMAELDYVITNPPGLLRLKKPTKAQLEEDPDHTGDPYANVGHMDELAFRIQCDAMSEDPRDPKFSKIHGRLKEYQEPDAFGGSQHPYFTRWETVYNERTARTMLSEHADSWDRAKGLLLGDRLPTRNLHPVLCGMCRWQEMCAIELRGGRIEDQPVQRTLPVLTDSGVEEVSCVELH